MPHRRQRNGPQGLSPHRIDKMRSQSLLSSPEADEETLRNVVVDCGWGRLLFAQTFDDMKTLTDTLIEEKPGCRDIAFYLREPHVALSMAPQQLFLDPSHAFRLHLSTYRPSRQTFRGFVVRRLC